MIMTKTMMTTTMTLISRCVRLSFQGDCDTSFGARFTYSIFSEELIVGEIFVRIYNDQPLFPLEVGIVMFHIMQYAPIFQQFSHFSLCLSLWNIKGEDSVVSFSHERSFVLFHSSFALLLKLATFVLAMTKATTHTKPEFKVVNTMLWVVTHSKSTGIKSHFNGLIFLKE